MNKQDFARQQPEAFAALPEVYQANNTLDFYQENEVWYARPLAAQVLILGRWVAKYDGSEWHAIYPSYP